MIGNILSDRVRDVGPANAIEQEHVLLELLQQYVLASLARARFFSHAMFHGGTCLRILFGMTRFSEDLDFLLKQPVDDFRWTGYLERIQADLADEGIRLELQVRSKPGVAVQKASIKTNAIGEIPIPDLPYPPRTTKKLRIRLEVDTNPPAGSVPETCYLSFPVTAAITTLSARESPHSRHC